MRPLFQLSGDSGLRSVCRNAAIAARDVRSALLPQQDKDARWPGKDNNALEPHPLGCGIGVQEIAYATLV